ncbi:PXA domain-domain-containing protein [Absidia repens]|uniref:PXA domain-domain-containing protein n=1 Tax=Absidia repens TaxID=90262 RepID=A0A1X2IT20_9FUNG|nr:PXA domain-domain-containing protein [Absidia repens]
MMSSLYSSKKLFIILSILCLSLEYYWPYTLYSLVYIIRLGILSLWGLLVLNLFVLYIYVKYFISPTRVGQDSRNKLDLEDFRPFRFTQKHLWSRLEQQREHENDLTSLPKLCDDNNAAISAAFDELLSYVLRDFIQSWFDNLSPQEHSFPKSVDDIIRSAALELKRRLTQVDSLSVLLHRLIPRITAHISEFRASEVALRGRFLERTVTESDELDLLLASHYAGGKLHPALTTAAVTTTKPTEVAYLRQLVDRLLPKLLNSEQVACAPVRVIIREIATCALLQPTMSMLADPDFWNQTIDTQLGMALREQKMVRQLREVLDRHSSDIDILNELMASDPANLMNSTATPSSSFSSSKQEQDFGGSSTSDNNDNNNNNSNNKQQRRMDPISQFSSAFLGMDMDDDVAWDDQDFDPEKPKKRQNFGSSRMGRRTFQEFLKMIEEEKNLLDLKRARNDVVTQLRKKKALILDRDPEEVVDGEKVEDLIVYVNRLGVAKKRVDKRIATLSGEHVDFKTSASQFFGVRKQRPKQLPQTSGFTLHDILTNTAGLSYFMEFMDRRGDMVKLQFWLIVEGFRSSDNDGAKRDDRTFLQDVKMVYEMYFASTSPHRLAITDHLDKDLLQSIQHAQQEVMGGADNAAQWGQAMQEMQDQLYRIQQHVLWQLEKEHFPYFKRSDLYFKFLASSPTPDVPPPGRRSLDDTSLYRRSSSVGQKQQHHHRPSSHGSNFPQHPSSDNSSSTSTHQLSPPQSTVSLGIERSLSARMTTKRTASWIRRDSGQKADSDTEISTREKKRPSISVSTVGDGSGLLHQGSENDASLTTSPSLTTSLNQGTHTRTYSDTVSAGGGTSSKFLSFGRVLGSANDWWRATDFGGVSSQQHKAPSIKRSSLQGSVKSTDTEYPDSDEELSRSVTTLYDDQQTTPPYSSSHPLPPPPQSLIRRNTVDAVEAELQSIIDGKENSNEYEKEERTLTTTPSSSSTSSSSLSRPNSSSAQGSLHRSPTILLGGTGSDIKSATADPVAFAKPVPSWTSLGDTQALSQVMHHHLLDSGTQNDNQHTTNDLSLQKSKLISGNDTKNEEEKRDHSIKNVHLAPPGDLMLADKVNNLSDKMEKLTQQEAIVDALIKKAEAKGKVEELRILIKSKNMFRRELEQMQYQKSQYEFQESENVLTPDRTKVSITSSTIGSDQHGDFALYVIEIQQVGFDGNYASGWIVARRYSEFFGLHQKLKSSYASVKMIDFPSKWPLLKLQKSFVEARRINLERYLKRLLEQPEICHSEALRVFLSQQNIYVPGPQRPSSSPDAGGLSPFGFFPFIPSSFQGMDLSSPSIHPPLPSSSSSSSVTSNSSPTARHLHRSLVLGDESPLGDQRTASDKKTKGFMRHIYNTVAAGIDDLFVTPSMLDLITQRLGEQVIGFSNDGDDNDDDDDQRTPPQNDRKSRRGATDDVGDMVDETMHTAAAAAAAAASMGSDLKHVDVEGMTRFTEPLCDLFIEMFELKEKNNWLRRQAVMIILQQILGGTIERKLRDTVKYLETESMVIFYFRKIMDSLWPGGAKLTFKPARKPDEKLQTKEEANRKLSTWLPDLLGNMVGRQNARKGARRLFSVLQNQRLNQHLVYVLLDEIVMALFPDIDDPTPLHKV